MKTLHEKVQRGKKFNTKREIERGRNKKRGEEKEAEKKRKWERITITKRYENEMKIFLKKGSVQNQFSPFLPTLFSDSDDPLAGN